MNIGERTELLAKLMLIDLRDNKQSIQQIGTINSVSFEGVEYPSLPAGITIGNIQSYNDTQLIQLCGRLGINVASPSSKADIFINRVGYSLKAIEGALPALINHTPRHLMLRVCNQELNIPIDNLDKAVQEYWSLRLSGEIGEDIIISHKLSPFNQINVKNDLQKILEYFLFIGTGSRKSANPADYLIEISDPFSINTWNIFTPSQAIKKYIDNVTISIRSKGMPETYTPYSQNANHLNIRPWVQYIQNSYKGSIHVRG